MARPGGGLESALVQSNPGLLLELSWNPGNRETLPLGVLVSMQSMLMKTQDC